MIKGLKRLYRKKHDVSENSKDLDDSNTPEHIKRGVEGEEKAWSFLKDKGFVLLEKNWHEHPHEIDLICEYLDMIIFVEVKSRKSKDNQSSLAAFSLQKQKNIVQAAKKYLTKKNFWHKPCRFDLVCISQEHKLVEHFENVIEEQTNFTRNYRGTKSRNAQHSGNASWQPW